VRVFADPFALTEHGLVERGELRWQTLGLVEGHTLLLVAHTIREEDEEGQPIEVVRIISARSADRKERQAMSKKLVKRTIDLANPPALTRKQKAELEAVAARPDREIDYSDIPPLPEAP